MPKEDTDESARAQPQTLTADQAISRLQTWTEDPGEDIWSRVMEAAFAWTDDPLVAHEEELRAAVGAYRAGQVERVQTSTGSMGCAWDADDIRKDLRASSMIVEVAGETMAGVMLRARGCYIAYKDGDGRWRGVGSSKAGQS